MEKKVFVSCPLDCPDQCRFIVRVNDGRVTGLTGDKQHPVTQGIICKKGRALMDRLYHPDRIKHPLIRKKDGFVRASYDEVFNIIADKLTTIRSMHGPTAILNYTSGGYGGVKNQIQSIFFNCFGGATVPEGSLCWGAGIAAQRYDFGNAKGHSPDDILNADTILVWGRNPIFTNLHLYTRLKTAQKKGSRIVVIDPVKTGTAKAFDEYIRINPSTDGALALCMANVIVKNGLYNEQFCKRHVLGFNRFKDHVAEFNLEKGEQITGIPQQVIEALAYEYARSKRAAIYIGYGMQRYHNSGNAVRCIDALASITGNIGQKGCGVNYAAFGLSRYLYDLDKKSKRFIKQSRSFVIGRLGAFLNEPQKPEIKAIFVASANPLTQSPDIIETKKGFSKIGLKVVFDHFMTDTARLADIVLPAAFVFEQDDLFTTSMYSHIFNFSEKAIEPPDSVFPEFEFYLTLAQKMGMDNLGFTSSDDFLQKSSRRLQEKYNKTFDQLPGSYLGVEGEKIAWEDKRFDTPSKKIELYSETARLDGQNPLPSYLTFQKGDAAFPLRLLTCHTRDSLHSQNYAFTDELPVVYVSQKTAEIFDVQNDTKVSLVGKKAKIIVRLSVSEDIGDNTAFMYQGFWHKSGAVNFLTDSVISDMGNQAAYYDSFCRIEKSV